MCGAGCAGAGSCRRPQHRGLAAARFSFGFWTWRRETDLHTPKRWSQRPGNAVVAVILASHDAHHILTSLAQQPAPVFGGVLLAAREYHSPVFSGERDCQALYLTLSWESSTAPIVIMPDCLSYQTSRVAISCTALPGLEGSASDSTNDLSAYVPHACGSTSESVMLMPRCLHIWTRGRRLATET